MLDLEDEPETPAILDGQSPGSAPRRKSRQGVKLHRQSLYCEEKLSDDELEVEPRRPSMEPEAGATPSSARRKLDLGDKQQMTANKKDLATQLF